MKQTIIGISSGFIFDENYSFSGYPRLATNEDYSRSVQEAGATPILLPITKDYAVAKAQVQLIDALLLSGGQDVMPHAYGEEPLTVSGVNSIERDIYEVLLIQAALELDKPIMGICRGSQILNVYFGGTLYQDNSLKEGANIKHVQEANPSLATHTITIDETSFLFEAVGEKTLLVNSFHHQSIKDIAPNLKAVAYAQDGIVEAIEATDPKTFIFAVQWHPEMLSKNNVAAQKIFSHFIQKVETYHNSK